MYHNSKIIRNRSSSYFVRREFTIKYQETIKISVRIKKITRVLSVRMTLVIENNEADIKRP